jgi:hypothetical protein
MENSRYYLNLGLTTQALQGTIQALNVCWNDCYGFVEKSHVITTHYFAHH